MAATESGVRCAFLDTAPGETRALVTLDGQPERLFILREGDPTPRLGQRFAARVEAASGRLGLARLDIGVAPATLKLKGGAGLAVGARLAVEVAAEPARGKPATVRRIAEESQSSAPGPLGPPPSIERRLRALGLADWACGDEAREIIDEAETYALEREYAFGSGLVLTLEPTRALTAVDVDLAETGAAVSVARANAMALQETARLLRLKSLGGLVAIDLVGFPADGARLVELARQAFKADGDGVAIARPSRFGVMELSRPHARQPLHEQLLDADGRPTPRTAAQRLSRAVARQGRFDPGARLVATCAPEVAAEAASLIARLGPRFSVQGRPGTAREAYDIAAI